jgi:hypothetical protein
MRPQQLLDAQAAAAAAPTPTPKGKKPMASDKTVNATVIVVRDGSATTQNFPALGYATFVALQSACAGVLSMLQSWGAIRVADMAEGRESARAGGECELRLSLIADHGGGGTSEVTLSYTGISAKDADEITGAMMGAVASVVQPKA